MIVQVEMKRWLFMVLLALAMIGSSACGDDENGNETASANNANTKDTSDGNSSETDTSATEDVTDDTGADTNTGADTSTDTETDVVEVPVELSAESIALADQVDAARYEEELTFVTGMRAPGSLHWQAVQDRCAEVFEASGFTVERHDYGVGVNVIGVKPGTVTPEEYVVVSAHYDGIPGCQGADDNASGTAGVLEAAKVLGGDQLYERTLVVACWDQEELGKIGAIAWTARAKRQNFQVHASFVLESIAFKTTEPNSQLLPNGFELLFPEAGDIVIEREYRGDFMTAIGDDINKGALDEFVAHAARVGLPTVPVVLDESFRVSDAFADLRRSDHDAFWREGWPGIMLTDTANFRNPYYHCAWGQDSLESLDMEIAVQTVQATIGAAAGQAVPTSEGEPGSIDTTTDTGPTPFVCDIKTQTGCGVGEHCNVIYDTGWAVACVGSSISTVGLGETCARPDGVAGIDDCEEGAYCAYWDVPKSEPQARVCHAICGSDAECEGGEGCIRLGKIGMEFGLCSVGCDPRNPSAVCLEGTVCIQAANVDPGHESYLCVPGEYGSVQAGESCEDSTCAVGLSCIPGYAGRTAVCVEFCEADSDCPSGASCVSRGVRSPTESFGRCAPG